MNEPGAGVHRLRRKYELYNRACALPAPERGAFLAEQVGEDPDLITEIAAMFEPSGGGLTADIRDIVEVWRRQPGATIHPDTIGPYRVLNVLGEGGMGTVYAAAQFEPVERVVAIKVIREGDGDLDRLARFEREGQALAMMDHDRIAKVYSAGVTPNREPYLVMELVEGQPLTDWCRDRRASIRDRVRLIAWLCDAVQHMHRAGLVHRDLKPQNVLVTAGEPQIKLVDFGLAKPTDTPLPRANFHTGGAKILRGTPGYMAPEQARGDAVIDTRADVHAVGAMLFELLTGETPVPFEQMSGRTSAALAETLSNPVVDPPSRRVAGSSERQRVLAHERSTTPTELLRSLRSDLDWLVMRAIEVDPNDRYGTIDALAADLRRYLENQPVEAHPPSWRYRLTKSYRRNRVKFLTAAMVAVAAIVSFTVMGVLALGWSRTIDDFDQLSSILAVRQLRSRAAAPGFARELPDNLDTMTRWLTDAAELLDQREEFERLAARLAREDVTSQPESGAERLLRNEITTLLAGLEDIAATRDVVRRRLDFTRQLPRGEITGNGTRSNWDEFRTSLAHAGSPYAEDAATLRHADMTGLIPIGRNGRTGLWEFYHLRSAWDGNARPADLVRPALARDGGMRMRAMTGIVLVLLPGHVAPGDARVDPFFIARHELTRAQWLRLGGEDAFWHDEERTQADAIATLDTLPAERIDWLAANEILANHGLCLPTDVQWRYAASAGSTADYWFGSGIAGLAGRANLRDRRAREVLGPSRTPAEPYRDRFARLAPVDVLEPNPFGLHHVHGNVMEWCQDRMNSNPAILPRPGDGLRVAPADTNEDRRVVRGGGYASSAREAKLRFRGELPECHRYPTVGVRVARRLRPE